MYLRWFIIGMFTWLCSGCVHENFDDQEEITIGSHLPAFQATMSDGSLVNTSILDDKPWMIVFFNTSCSDCRRELPLIQELYDDYAQQAHFVVIAREENDPSIKQFWNNNNLTMPYSAQSNRQIFSLFAQSEIPRIYVANHLGIITSIYKTSFDYSNIVADLHMLE